MAARRRDVLREEGGDYHVWTRCVRRALLMGVDPHSGKDFSHRRRWIRRRLELLVSCFTIDSSFFATLGNHLHLILRALTRLAFRLGDEEVARRWLRIFPGRLVLDDEPVEPTEEAVRALARDKRRLRKIRKRLGNVSWFMRALCEPIARRANIEDGTTGRFWAGRFGCRLLTSESAVLACALYVDLNEIRAGLAQTPFDSVNSSIHQRLSEALDDPSPLAKGSSLPPLELTESMLGEPQLSESGRRASDKGLLPMTLAQYTRFFTWVGTLPKEGKAAIPVEVAQLVEQVGLDPEGLRTLLDIFPGPFRRVLGSASDLRAEAERAGRRWFQGVDRASLIFRACPEATPPP